VNFVFAGDQHGGIAGAAGGEFARNFAAGDFFGGVEDFEDGKTAAIADVKSFAGDGFDRLEGAEVGIGDVQDVNVIADAGAVGGGIVRAENFEMRNVAKGSVENARDEMSFDAMGLAAFGGRSGSIEIAEGGVLEAGVGAVVREDFLEAEFGFAVWVDGIFGMIFRDGESVRLAVGGGGGRENELFHAVTSYGVEKIDAGSNVGSIERAGLADGFGDEGFACEMHYSVDGVLGENFLDLCADAQVGAAEDRFGRNGGGVALLKIIESNDLVAARQENLRADAADVARRSSYEYVQGSDLAFIGRMCIAFA